MEQHQQQYVGIDLHRRRSVIVRRTGDGETLETVRIDNDPVTLAAELAGQVHPLLEIAGRPWTSGASLWAGAMLAPSGLIVAGWWVEPKLGTQQGGLVTLEDLGVALQQAHQARAKRLVGTSHLGDRYGNGTLGGADPPRLIPVPRSPLALSSSLVAAPAAQEVAPARPQAATRQRGRSPARRTRKRCCILPR